MSSDETHIILNGEIISASLPSLSHINLSFLYGDGLHERMHAYGTEIQFVDSHFQRLYNGMLVMKISLNETLSQPKVIKEITRLLNRDKVFGGASIMFVVYREKENKFGYLVYYETLPNNNFQINQKGLTIDIFREMPRHSGKLSEFPVNNSLVSVMADIYAKEHNLDEVLLLNLQGNVIESAHSNIFLVNGNKLYTPSIDEGCIAGVMREQVLIAAKAEGLEVFSNCVITEKNILEADEVFLTNAVEGLKWVLAFKQRRYYNKIAKIICDKINDAAFFKQ